MVNFGKIHGFMRMYWAKKILEWTESQDEEVAKLSIYCSGDPFRQLVNKTPLCYRLVVLPEWYRAAEKYKEEVYNLLTQLGFKHQELTEYFNNKT